MHIIRDALEAHCKGTYTLSVPALTPQIEGVLLGYVRTNGIAVRLGSITAVYEAAIGDPVDHDLSTWVIATTLLFQLKSSNYAFSDFETELTKSANRRRTTRHTILHGVATRYDRPIVSLKAFLTLDALSALDPYDRHAG